MIRRPPRSPLFPYPPLFRSGAGTPPLRVPATALVIRDGPPQVVTVGPDSTVRYQTVTIGRIGRSEEHTSELQSRSDLVCRLLLEKKNTDPTFTAPSPQAIMS